MRIKLLTFTLSFILYNHLQSQCNASFLVQGKHCFGDTLNFSFNGSGDSLFWNFDDANSGTLNYSNDSNVNHLFSDYGFYNVRLIVKDTNNCSDTFIHKIRIYQKSIVDFELENTCEGILTKFNNLSIIDTFSSISNYKWSFGNGNFSNYNPAFQNYTNGGNYNVKLVIKTTGGCEDSITKTVNIYTKPIITISNDSICQNIAVSFNLNTGVNNTSFVEWNLGDGTTSSNGSLNHQYNSPGKKKISLKLNFQAGGSCFYNNDSIYVFEIPNAHFNISTPKIQCFVGNQTCISFSPDTTGIKSRSIIWDDGSLNNVNPILSSTCYNYLNKNGGVYRITQDVIDNNGCVSRFTTLDSVKILKKPEAKFVFYKTGGCFKTYVNVTNTSNISPPVVKNFEWDWDDNQKDSSIWSSNNHTYTDNGNFKIKLKIVDTFGCQDIFSSNDSIRNTSYVVDAKNIVLDSCRISNLFGFRQTPISGGSIKWYFGDTDSSSAWNPNYSYHRGIRIGDYSPRVRISKNGCDSSLNLGMLTVYGPYPEITFLNRFQCISKDTVFFQNSTITHKNKNLKVNWDANDIYSSNCVINSKIGQNVDSNCNLSVDSMYFKHMYRKHIERCYMANLTVEDTILGCKETRSFGIPLMKPDASKGINLLYNGSLCLGPEQFKTVRIDIDQNDPNCGREDFWVMWDSTCAAQSGNFNAHWRNREYYHNYHYVPCDTNGYVSIGLIIKNGTDTLDNVCIDTFFYNNRYKFGLIDPRIVSSYNPNQQYCKGTEFEFSVNDTTYSDIVEVIWNFGDGTIVTDSFLGKRLHKYTQNGSYRVTVRLKHLNGCEAIDSLRIKVGNIPNIISNKTRICIGDSVTITNNSRYINGTTYWKDPTRSGIEKTRWDINDGNGFSLNSPIIKITYPKIGNYTIKMEYTDSAGCVDTFEYAQKIRYFDVFSSMRIPLKTYICNQVIQLFSTASVYDSINNFGHNDDQIIKFSWNFDNNSSNSLLMNPFKYFKTGVHDVKLVVENTIGCKDSITDNFEVIGPKADYQILTDTVGCQSLPVTFKNNSTNATSYTWRFRNPSNSVTNINNMNNVSFTYTNFGVFFPELIARRTFNNNGINVTCADTFPNFNSTYRPTVDVKEKPRPNFTHSTNCALNRTTFTNATAFTTGTVAKYEWFFGDGDTSHSRNIVHDYPDTGAYRVVMKAYSSFGCVDSVVRIIYISPFPKADFTFTEVCIGLPTQFTDLSTAYNDIITQRSWNFRNGVTSTLINPSLIYAKDSVSYNVILTVRNRAGCTHTVTKAVNVWAKPKPNFNFNNNCHKSAVTFVNTTTSKQNPHTVLWRFGDGSIDSIFNPSKIYSDTGNYNVKLIATSAKGCKDSIAKVVRTYPNPIANFSINNPIQCFKQNKFVFNNLSTIARDTIKFYNWDLSDNSSYNSQNLVKTFSSYDSFNIRLIVRTNRNCYDTINKNVKILQSPVSTIINPIKNQCINGDSLMFSNSSQMDSLIVSRIWNMEDGNFITFKEFKYKYNILKNYRVSLINTNIWGCKDTLYDSVYVRPKPVSRISYFKQQQCYLNNLFILKDSSSISDNTALNNNWNFGDGNSSINKNINHSYSIPDTFKISLITNSLFSCKDTTNKTVIVHAMPNVDFNILNDSQCRKENIFNFTDKTTLQGNLYSNLWKFGDGQTSNLKNPNHIYSNHGNFYIKLIATSLFGCMDSVSKLAVVHPMPVANFSLINQAMCLKNNEIVAINQSTIPYTNIFNNWESFTTLRNNIDTFKINYPKDSVYIIKLKVKSEYNCIDSIEKTVTIWPMPLADFSIDTNEKCFRNHQFTFTNQSKINSGSLSYFWNFGDNNQTNLINPKHSYSFHDFYDVKLISISNFNCIDSTTKTVKVRPMPIAAVWINDSAQCLNNQNFLFVDTSIIDYGTIKSKWVWHDLNEDTLKHLSRTFDIDQTLYHQLISTSEYHCSDSVDFFTTLHSVPVPDFTINDSNQCLNVQNYIFTNNSIINKGTLNYVWNFDDGNFSSTINSTNKFNNHGIYNVNLKAISEFGCFDSIFKSLRVYDKPNVSVNVFDSQCLLDNKFELKGTSTIREGTIDKYLWYQNSNLYSTNKDTIVKYNTQGNYQMEYVLISNYGCSDTLINYLTVHPMPISSFKINNNIQCENNNLFAFNSTSTIPYSNLFYEWNIEKSMSDTNKNIQRIYLKSDTLEVQLITISEFNCRDSAYNTIYIQPKPVPNFNINKNNQCLKHNQYQFTNTSQIGHGTMIYSWNMDDSTISNSKDINHKYKKHKDYFVELKVVSDWGCRDSINKKVIVFPDPIAQFNVNNYSQCLRNNQFIFANLTTIDSSNLSYTWKFGDNVFSQQINPTHSYKTDGKFSVQLFSTSAHNCADTITKIINVSPMPISQFNINRTSQCINEQDFILNNQSTIKYGKIDSLKWITNQIIFSQTDLIQPKYNTSGFKNVVLRVVSDSLCVDSIVKTLRVFPKPISNFTINDSSQCLVGNQFIFNNNSFDSFGIVGSKWFIDEDLSSINNPFIKTFDIANNQSIKLVAYSNNQCKDTITKNIRVKPMPDPSFTTLKDYYCNHEPVLSLVPITTGGTFDGKNVINTQYFPKKLWKDTVKYTVTVEGCTSTGTQYTNVYPLPIVELGKDTQLCKFEAIMLKAHNWNSTYLWQDGRKDPEYLAFKPGLYHVTVTNICGSVKDSIDVKFKDKNCRLYLPTAFTPNGDPHNPYYKPITYGIDEMQFEIFNRWGEKIFEGDINSPGWDGTYMGDACQDGYFMVLVKFEFNNGYRNFLFFEKEVFYLLK